MEDKWMSKIVTTLYGCSVWSAIRKVWPLMQIKTKVKIWNGQRTFFWHDKWAQQGTMKQQHPEFFTLSQQQHATVAMMWTGHGWNLFLRRHLNDWEMEKVAEFYNSVAGFNKLNGGENILKWSKDKNGKFSVNSAYKGLNSAVVKESDWPWKMIWTPKIPYKVNCFTCLLAKEAVLTQKNLSKRGHQLVAECFLCGEQPETINHLFFAWQVYKPTMEDVYIPKRDQMGETWKHSGCPKMQEQGWHGR